MSRAFSSEDLITDVTHWIDKKGETRDNEFHIISGDIDDTVYNSSDDEPDGGEKKDDDNEHLDNEEESVQLFRK